VVAEEAWGLQVDLAAQEGRELVFDREEVETRDPVALELDAGA
jgi:hypothetical protein